MPKYSITIRTDENGLFQASRIVDPPIWRRTAKIRLRAVRTDDVATKAHAILDIDAVDGSPQNDERRFVLVPDWEVDMGVWEVDRDENIVVVRGKTEPPVKNADLQVTLHASLTLRS